MRREIWVALLVAMSPVFATLSLAQTNNWIGTASTAWTSGPNWSLGKVPDMTQSAVIITNGASGEVDIGHLITAIAISNLEVAGNSLVLQDTFSLYIFNELNVRALNAGSTPGALIVSNSDLTVQGLQGGEFDANGTITLVGVALLTTNCLLNVGNGLFIISNGVGNVRDVNIGGFGNEGTMEIMAGTMTLSSTLSVEGSFGSGNLLLNAGGILIATNADTGINGDEGSAFMTVSNATFDCAGLTLGGGGDGSSALTIEDGTVSVGGEFCIGCGAVVSANVLMNNGVFTATNNITLLGSGQQGDGTLTIDAGTYLGRQMLVGINSNCTGNVSMSGGSIHLSSSLQVGSASNGVGLVSLGADMTVTNGNTMVEHTGEIDVSAGGLLTAAHIIDTGQLSADGGIITALTGITLGDCGAGVVGDISVEFGGEVIATNATGTGFVDIRDGVLVLNDGTLQVDQLVITNTCGAFAHFNGTVIAGKVVLDPNAFRIKSVVRQGNDFLVTWLMGPGISNFLQVATGGPNGSYSTNTFSNLFVVVNNSSPGTITNFLDVGGATNRPARYYRARLVP